MGETLISRRRVEDEGLRVVNSFYKGISPAPLGAILDSMYFVYVIKGGSNPEYYVGFTKNLKQRLQEHNSGKNISTKRGKPWKLIYFEGFTSETLARKRESKLKQFGKAWQELKKRVT